MFLISPVLTNVLEIPGMRRLKESGIIPENVINRSLFVFCQNDQCVKYNRQNLKLHYPYFMLVFMNGIDIFQLFMLIQQPSSRIFF